MKGKSAIPPLLNGPKVLSSASDKETLFANYDSGISLPAFPSRTYLKLNNICVMPKLVKKVIRNTDLSKASVDCILVVVLTNYELEFSHTPAELLDMFLKKNYFPRCWKIASVVPVFKNVGERSKVKEYHPVSLLPVISKIFEQLFNNMLVCHLKECDLFPDFQSGFRSGFRSCYLYLIEILEIHKNHCVGEHESLFN